MLSAPRRRGSVSKGERLVSEMECPNCAGTGYTLDATGEDILCPLCDGAGILFDDEDAPDGD